MAFPYSVAPAAKKGYIEVDTVEGITIESKMLGYEKPPVSVIGPFQ